MAQSTYIQAPGRHLGLSWLRAGCSCELFFAAKNRGRHDSNVDFDGFCWAVVYQKDDNYCWGVKAQAWCCVYEQTAIKQS